MGKNNEHYTTLKLCGQNAEKYLMKKGIFDATPTDEQGNFIIGRAVDSSIASSLGDIPVSYDVVDRESHRNYEVVLEDSLLRLRGHKSVRRISVTNDNADNPDIWHGKQELTNGVLLTVETNVPVTVFERNKR